MEELNKNTKKNKWLKGCGIGCGIGCLIIVILVAAGSFVGFRYFKGKLNTITKEFEEKGFHKVTGQLVEVNTKVLEPTLYVGQVVKITEDCKEDIAIVAQTAEIYSEIAGNVYFRGQILTIQPHAVLQKNLDVKTQIINIYGKVNGEIIGDYRVRRDKAG